MEGEHKHITSYTLYAKILIGLLILTFVTIAVTYIDLKALTVIVAMGIACVKAFIVLTYFMHLKYDGKMLRFFVAGVFIIYFLVILITFFDYLFR